MTGQTGVFDMSQNLFSSGEKRYASIWRAISYVTFALYNLHIDASLQFSGIISQSQILRIRSYKLLITCLPLYLYTPEGMLSTPGFMLFFILLSAARNLSNGRGLRKIFGGGKLSSKSTYNKSVVWVKGFRTSRVHLSGQSILRSVNLCVLSLLNISAIFLLLGPKISRKHPKKLVCVQICLPFNPSAI